MAKGIREHEPDARAVYGELIDLPRWEPKEHTRMNLYQRAAQFAPFAALTGYEDMVSEESRLTDCKTDPGEDAQERLDRALNRIAADLSNGSKPLVSVTWFVPDLRKSGGSYATVTDTVHALDPVRRVLILRSGSGKDETRREIPFDQITEILPDPPTQRP